MQNSAEHECYIFCVVGVVGGVVVIAWGRCYIPGSTILMLTIREGVDHAG